MGECSGGSLRAGAAAPAPSPLPPRPHLWLLPLQGGDGRPLLSGQEQGWCAGLPEPLQQRYRRSRSQLRQCLAVLLQRPPLELPLHSPPGEPPTLAAGWGHVSLSHSGPQLLLAWSPWPIGVDLERAARPLLADGVARRFFPASEWQQLQGLPAEALRRAVLESWVLKEAAIKWQRGSIAQDLRHWRWDANRAELRHLQHGWTPGCCLRLHDGWCCAVVGHAADQGLWV